MITRYRQFAKPKVLESGRKVLNYKTIVLKKELRKPKAMLWDNDGSGYEELKKEGEQNKPELAGDIGFSSKTDLKPYITSKNKS